MLWGQNNILAASLKQKTKFVNYKYSLNYLSKTFTIYIRKHIFQNKNKQPYF